MADFRHSGERRARSEAFQRYPGGEFNNPDTSLRGMTLEDFPKTDSLNLGYSYIRWFPYIFAMVKKLEINALFCVLARNYFCCF